MPVRRMIATVVLSLGCTAAQSDSTDSDDATRAALDARRAEIEQIAVTRDPDAFLALWTSDLYVREPGMAMDRAQFEPFIRDVMGNGGILSLDIRPAKLHIHGDAAYEFGEYDERVLMGADTLTLENNYAMRWARDTTGRWLIDHLVAGPRAAPSP